MMTELRFAQVMVVLLVIAGCDPTDPEIDGGEPPVDTGTPPPPSAMCPTHLRFTNTSTTRNIGWTGILHSTQVSSGAVFTVVVTDCDEECRHCRVEGLAPNRGINNQRCVLDTRIQCSSDDDCGTAGPCYFLYGPPLTIQTGPFSTLCITGGFEPPAEGGPAIRGTVDLVTGQMSFDRFVIGGAINRPPNEDGTTGSALGACGSCVGDTTPEDGEADGTCMRADVNPGPVKNMGAACDVHGRGGPVADMTTGFFSYDCVADGVVQGTQVDNWAPLSTLGARWTMTNRRPHCTADGHEEERCWCGLCSDDGSTCTSDRDCASGTCGGFTGEGIVGTEADACREECDWDPETASGTCEIRPTLVGMPITAGCFPSGEGATIEVSGAASERDGSYFVTLASLGCYAPGSASDILFGVPGAVLNRLQFRVDTEVRE